MKKEEENYKKFLPKGFFLFLVGSSSCCYCVTPKATASFIKRHAIMWINKFLMKSLRSSKRHILKFLQINTLTWKSSRDVALHLTKSTASHFVINCLKEDIKRMKREKNRQNCHACAHKEYLKEKKIRNQLSRLVFKEWHYSFQLLIS